MKVPGTAGLLAGRVNPSPRTLGLHCMTSDPWQCRPGQIFCGLAGDGFDHKVLRVHVYKPSDDIFSSTTSRDPRSAAGRGPAACTEA
jgi:hypothetical protein